MDIFHFRQFDQPGPHDAVLTIGNFDGVHLGHQALIRRVVAEARRLDVAGALMTFNPHPQSVLGQHPVPVITSIPLRLRLFEGLGLDAAYFVPFTRALAGLTPEAFVREYLLAYFQVRKLVIGYDFHFGRGRSGSAEVLQGLSERHGFDFEVFPAFQLDGRTVSSSRIREVLAAGDFRTAQALLGRPYSVLEPVVQGERRGRSFGFPTLNQRPRERLPLTHGVYASRTVLHGRTYRGVSNYGVRPTFGSPAPTLETHLFDYDGDEAYGALAEVVPVRHLRPERAFPDVNALRDQIARDCETARTVLAEV